MLLTRCAPRTEPRSAAACERFEQEMLRSHGCGDGSKHQQRASSSFALSSRHFCTAVVTAKQ
eukprot:2721695-Prymnesium_polylepis.1